MHLGLGLLTALVSILYLLDRAGIDIGGLNPFHWRRRRAWSKQYHGDPIFAVEDPLHIAALLIIGVAKLEGDLTTEQKTSIIDQFTGKFSMDSQEATGMLASAAHLLAAPQLIANQLATLAERSASAFSAAQAISMLEMMTEVASSSGNQTAAQREYVEKMHALFAPKPKGDSPWD